MARHLLIGGASVAVLWFAVACAGTSCMAVSIRDVKSGEDIFGYMARVKGGFDQTLYRQLIGAANEFKEGDATIGVAADGETDRSNARLLLANTRIGDLFEHPLLEDNLQKLIWETTDRTRFEKIADWTMGHLKDFLLSSPESEIKAIMHGLSSEAIGCVPKLMTDEELIALSRRIFNPLPGTGIGAKGYLSARIQPNSPTDNPTDIVWEIFDGFSYAVGDLLLGTNPVDSQPESVAGVEKALKDIVETFGLQDVLPWCVLSHIDVQAAVEGEYPGSVAILFQSLAGTDDVNKTFDISVEKMLNYAKSRAGERYGFYFETGQGADFTNGGAGGVDMVVLESRKYGFARAIRLELEKTQPRGAWVHFNDVAGFIGPEVFKTREQLVRCTLEDIAMGKLHGLVAGLDICSTLHMEVTLEDLDWCQDRIMPANPGYLMALPTKNDPMLGYLTTAYQDHVRIRDKFGYKVNDAMWAFFKRIGIVDENDAYTEHFGDPIWVYYQYRLAKGDHRSKEEIYAEGRRQFREVEARGVDLAVGHGPNLWDLNPQLAEKVSSLYRDAKASLRAEFTSEFVKTIPNALPIATTSKDREDYIAHPETGEKLSAEAVGELDGLRNSWQGKPPNVQIVISDGLNARAIMDEGHLAPYLEEVRRLIREDGGIVGEKNIVVTNGRVRAGYEIGAVLFGNPNSKEMKAILHIIGERPGTMHHTYSVYITSPKGKKWARRTVDHDITRVVSGIADTALPPRDAAAETLAILKKMTGKTASGSRRLYE